MVKAQIWITIFQAPFSELMVYEFERTDVEQVCASVRYLYLISDLIKTVSHK